MDAGFEARLRAGDVSFTERDARLLRAIDEAGSLLAAAEDLERSYSRSHERVTELEEAFGPLVARERGGSGGGGSALTERAAEVLAAFARLRTGYTAIAETTEAVLDGTVRERDGELGVVETDAGAVRAIVPPEAERVQVALRADAVTLHAPADAPPESGTSARNRFEGTVAATDALDGLRPDADVLEQGVLPHRLDALEHYMELPHIMRTGEAPEHTETGLRHYMGAMATIDEATVRQIVTVAEHAHPRPDRVLDVGGGPGRFTAEWRNRGADVTTVDLPPVVDLLGDHHEAQGFDVRPGDATAALPTGFDLVFSARMIPSFSPADLRDYFENAYEALDPGGTFVCTERVWDRSASARRFGFHMLTVAETDHRYTADEYEAALADAGFVDTAIPEVPGTPFQGIVGHRPDGE